MLYTSGQRQSISVDTFRSLHICFVLVELRTLGGMAGMQDQWSLECIGYRLRRYGHNSGPGRHAFFWSRVKSMNGMGPRQVDIIGVAYLHQQ